MNQFHGDFHSKTLICGKIKYVHRDLKWYFNASWGLKGLKVELLMQFPTSNDETYFEVSPKLNSSFNYLSIFRKDLVNCFISFAFAFHTHAYTLPPDSTSAGCLSLSILKQFPWNFAGTLWSILAIIWKSFKELDDLICSGISRLKLNEINEL